MRAAVQDSIGFQRDLHVKEEDDAVITIRKEGGDIVELTPQEHALFARAVNPIFGEARSQYGRELLSLVGV
jgi:TRAP-type C4-dicarboxylate transport system substrate-binding protein